ncbi:MAG TPA: acetolactate decarboxylase [Candidatus Omnitrophota bacterium]|nr:acetolactate decarboxylase [Candidatus Omnitrophota bacterium]
MGIRSAPAVVLAACIWLSFSQGAFAQDEPRSLYQVSTIGALMQGIFEGDVTCGEVKKHGDFGIGTLNGLDGELILLEGVFYQVRPDGKVYSVHDSTDTPFVCVVPFGSGSQATVPAGTNFKELQDIIEGHLPTPNKIYAIRVTGTFKTVTTRSVTRQTPPYPTLPEAVDNQTVFDLNQTRGTFVGFYFPEFMGALNVPGFHFHYLNEEKSAGGHVLDCLTEEVTAEIMPIDDFRMRLLDNTMFRQAVLSPHNKADLEKAEQMTGSAS